MAVTRASMSRAGAVTKKPIKWTVARKDPEVLHKVVRESFRLQAHCVMAAQVAGNSLPTATLAECFLETFRNSEVLSFLCPFVFVFVSAFSSLFSTTLFFLSCFFQMELTLVSILMRTL